MKHLIPLVFTTLLASLPAQAGELEDIKSNYESCHAAANSTVESKNCNGDAYEKADAVLNDIYSGIVADLTRSNADEFEQRDNAEKLKRLKAAQRAWIAYRDTQCPLEGVSALGGTGEGVFIGDCYYRMTSDRSYELRKLFIDER
jgi:uncharacterized protein YecT (DUF1311 family)